MTCSQLPEIALMFGRNKQTKNLTLLHLKIDLCGQSDFFIRKKIIFLLCEGTSNLSKVTGKTFRIFLKILFQLN